ncbi:hypothetical protein OBV_05150 [Oscillibacter valericigenes Sjm18-20]|nr:hypothetical protein OBV_05150 [Oscillibacter valericigenes Sjm18-20]
MFYKLSRRQDISSHNCFSLPSYEGNPFCRRILGMAVVLTSRGFLEKQRLHFCHSCLIPAICLLP